MKTPFHVRMLRRKTLSKSLSAESKVEHAASFPPRPPATDLISKPHAPDHKPHPNDPGDREDIFSNLDYRKEGADLGIYKSVEELSRANLRAWNDFCSSQREPGKILKRC